MKDAEAFLAAAGLFGDLGSDVVATNAIHSAISSADVLCCIRLGQRSKDPDHKAAVQLLARVDRELAAALDRALNVKTRAGYESHDLADIDAKMCVRIARRLRNAARDALTVGG
jgi:hypothetical protein